MIKIKQLLKGLGILNDVDQSKSLEIIVPNSVTTGTKTTLQTSQTSNVTITLPNATTTLSGTSDIADLTNKTVSLSNTTDNKLLLSQAGTHKIVDSLITHIDNAGDAQLSATGNVSLTLPSTKEIILSGKAVRLPVVSFPVITPPSGNVGDIVFNSTTQTLWVYQTTGYVELLSGDGANKILSNLLSTQINQDLNPDINGRDLGTSLKRWDIFSDNASINSLSVVNDLIVSGNSNVQNLVVEQDLTVNGILTTINSQTLDVTDANITVNKNGSDVSAEGAGLTVDRTSTKGSLVFNNALASKFKVGLLGSESEIISASTAQTLTGDKTFSGKFNLQNTVKVVGSTIDFTSTSPVARLVSASAVVTQITNLQQGSYGLIINEIAGNVEFQTNLISTGIDIVDAASIVCRPFEAVMYYKTTSSDPVRLYYINKQVTADTMEFRLNGSYYDPATTFPVAAIDGLQIVPYDMMITNAFLYNIKAGDGGGTRFNLYTKDVVSGTWVSLFTTQPIILWSAGNDVWVGVGDTVTNTTAPVLNSGALFIPAGSAIKCDATALQSGGALATMPEDCGLILHYIKL